MERFLGILLFSLLLAANAEFLPVDGEFAELTVDGSPARWVLHEWSGFTPLAKLTVLPGADNGRNVVRISEIRGQYGAGFRNAGRLPGRCGDQIQVSFRVRGKGHGKGAVEIYHYTQDGLWNPPSRQQQFEFTSAWRTQVCSFLLTNGEKPKGETVSFQVCFEAEAGAEIELSDIRVEQMRAEFIGDLSFPKEWMVFAPVDPEFLPENGLLATIPETFGGKAPQRVRLEKSVLDFAPCVGGPGEKKCGWAFAAIEAPIDCDYTFGAGGDWWMEIYCNGEKVIDRMGIEGNGKAPVAPNNHVVTVRLHQGTNVLAARLITGSASSKLHLAGAPDLRDSISKVKLGHIDWMEDFDQQTLQVSGNPTLIQGCPTPGLLVLTGQGVFQAGDSALDILPERPNLHMPADPNSFLAFGVRIQNFGEPAVDGRLALTTRCGEENFEAAITCRKDEPLLHVDFLENGNPVETAEIPVNALPADFLFAANRMGDFFLVVDSLVDSSSRVFKGTNSFFANCTMAQVALELGPRTKVTVDNFLYGTALYDNHEREVPFRIDIEPTFNPDKAGWPLVFQDDFDGPDLDADKWEMAASKCNPKLMHFEDGKLVIQADWNADHTALEGVSLWSKPRFLYGFFEARVKFRKEHGWWSAFWLCVHQPSNAFVDGFEIDIYEDYYLRPVVPGGPPRDILDHNLHMFAGGGLKSWNYNSHLPGSIDDFYVVACKWTPFEISFYLNGKLIQSTASHSPYHSVTFDAFHHGTCIEPLSAILSASLGRSGGDPKDGNFPDQFEVDYVKIWGFPQDDLPEVQVKCHGADGLFLPEGRKLIFEVEATPAPHSKAPITGVYLMDSGFLMDFKTEPPYVFEVSMTPKFYSTTNFVKPGRTGVPIPFGKGIHAFSVMVQDADGKVAYSPPEWHFVSRNTGKKSTPYQGVAAVVPGRVLMSRYDEGGPDVAYFDTTPQNLTDKTGTFRPGEGVDCNAQVVGYVEGAEWLNYTINALESGSYTMRLCYGTPSSHLRGVMCLLDGVLVGEFPLMPHEGRHWTPDTVAELSGIRLTAGTHVLRFLFLEGATNFSHFDLLKED